MTKPLWTPSKLYPILIFIAAANILAGVWVENWRWAVGGFAAALFFLSLQLGTIYHQYTGIINLIQILNGLIVASLRAQGYEMEGTPSEPGAES
jgi:hypothetical protein